jgi:dynein heavy chain
MDVNVPKFTVLDTPLFVSITNDLFPGTIPSDNDNTLIKNKIIEKCREFNLQAEESFLAKCYQLQETLNVRHGLMCVGAAQSTKSKVVDVLAAAKTALKEENNPLFKAVHIQRINPKAITSDQLYGKLDSDTKQWSDGVAAIILRGFINDEGPDSKWIIFDGPVDAIWIENLNTVLDDNKKLCLTSGEIIKLNPLITAIFEVQDLMHASPATVSRCGMIYFEKEQLSWYALIMSFSN